MAITKKSFKVGDRIDLTKRVTVYGTGKFQMAKDKAYKVHPISAAKLIRKGAATEKLVK